MIRNEPAEETVLLTVSETEFDDPNSRLRLDVFVTRHLSDKLSRNAAAELIKAGCVTVDGKQRKANYALKPEETVSVTIPAPKQTKILPENIPLDILYEDSDILIVNKPKGMVVHPANGHPDHTLVNAVLYHCGDQLSGINGEIRPGIVHRIDRDTTGSLIVCKNDAAHRKIAEQMKSHSITRIYEGIVSGRLKEDSGTIRGNIGRDPKDRKKMAVVKNGGKPAVTHYMVLERFLNASYVRFTLETGRTHQIRVHMASIGHPLLGDPLYGTKKDPYHLQGQALHAKTIGLVHPSTGEYLEAEAPLPEYFIRLLERLRHENPGG